MLFVTVASSSTSTIGLKYLNIEHMLQISMNYCLIDSKMPGVPIHKFTIIEISIKTVKPNMNMGFKIWDLKSIRSDLITVCGKKYTKGLITLILWQNI